MAKSLKEVPMSTPSARDNLPNGTYWRRLDPKTHLGYRKNAAGGVWLVRWRLASGAYRQSPLGPADDVLKGEAATNFDEAQRLAKERVRSERAAEMAAANGEVETVRSACLAYLEGHAARVIARGGKPTRGTIHRHVLPDEIADIPLHSLTRDQLREWRRRVAATGKSVATVRRACNDLRAALNEAADIHHKRLPAAFPQEVKAGLAAGEEKLGHVDREAQVLPDADVRAILAAASVVDARDEWEGDLFRLVAILAATGARFSQVVRLTCGDVQAAHGRLMVPTSHKGRGTKARKTPVPVGDDILTLLRPALAGRKGPEILLLRWRKIQTGPATWERADRGPWRTASEMTRAWGAILKEAGLPADIIPYALRHSSIVRGLREGLPVRLVAQVHDTSTQMIEQHYASFIASALDGLAARAVVPLAPTEPPRLRAV